MFELIEQAKQDISQNPDNAGIVFIILFVILALIVGLPQILKGNLKEFIISILSLLLAIGGTYFLFFG